MTRLALAVATAFLAVAIFLVPAAEACISCEYTPEVGRSTAKAPPKAKRVQKPRATVKRPEQRAKKRVVKPAPAKQTVKPSETAKAPAEPEDDEETETEAAVESETETPSEEPTTETADGAPDTRKPPPSGSATAVFAGRDAARAEQARSDDKGRDEDGVCTKFSAQVGGVVEVPCD